MRNLFLILGVILLFVTPANSENPIVGHPRVVDGDSLNFGITRVRLQGIDSPERKQLCTDENAKLYWCGVEATKAIAAQIGNGLVRCVGAERDRYKRILATCYNEAGENLNKWMVLNERCGPDFGVRSDRDALGRMGVLFGPHPLRLHSTEDGFRTRLVK